MKPSHFFGCASLPEYGRRAPVKRCSKLSKRIRDSWKKISHSLIIRPSGFLVTTREDRGSSPTESRFLLMPLHLIHPVHRATHRIGLYLNQLRESDLSQGEAHILALLADSSPAHVSDLHRGLGHKRSTLTSILDRLTGRGLITRNASKRDRRSFVIMLTAKGQKLARRVSRHLSDLERAVARRVSATDMKGFENVISALQQEAHLRSRPGGCRPNNRV